MANNQVNQQIQAAESALRERQRQIALAKEKISQAENKLPQIRSESVRRRMGGIRGLRQRNIVGDLQSQIDVAKGRVQSFEKELQKSGQSVSSLREFQEKRRQIERAEKLYRDRIPIAFAPQEVQDELKEFYKSGSLAKESFLRDVAKIQQQIGSDNKLVVDLKNFKIQGVESTSAMQSFDVAGFNRALRESQPNFTPMIDESLMSVDVPRQVNISIGEVQPYKSSIVQRAVNLPSNIFEKVTGRKPREAFRFVTGSKEKDITKPLSTLEVVRESTQVPMRATQIVSYGAGNIASKVTEKLVGEGIPVSIKGGKNVTFIEPQFGTISADAPKGFIEKQVVTKPRRVNIFSPKRVGEAVSFGTEFSAFRINPTAFSLGFISSGAEKALTADDTSTRLLGSLEAGLGTFVITEKATRFARTPIVREFEKRVVNPSDTVIVSKPTKVGDETKLVSVFETRGEVRPPIIREETTRIKNFLGFKPKVTEIPARTFILRSPEPIIPNEPFIVSETVKGRKFATIRNVEQGTADINLDLLPKVKGVQKELVERSLGRIFSGDTQLSSTLTKSRNILRVSPKPRSVDINYLRDSKTKFSLSSTARRNINENFVLGRSATRELSSLSPRRGGNIEESRFVSIILNEKATSSIGGRVFRPSKSQVQELEKVQEAIVSIPKPQNFKKVSSPITEVKSKVSSELPSILGGSALQEASEFTGRIEYEVNNFEVLRSPLVSGSSSSLDFSGRNITSIKTVPLLNLSQFSLSDNLNKSFNDLSPRVREDSRTSPRITTIPILGFGNVPSTNISLGRSNIQKNPVRTPPKKPTKIRTPIRFPDEKESPKPVKQKSDEESLFEVFTRKGGKDISIGFSKTREEAFKLLGTELTGKLRASGFVSRAGKKVRPTGFGLDFRPSKVDPFRVVEKRQRRLRKGTTGRQIQAFKKGGGARLL